MKIKNLKVPWRKTLIPTLRLRSSLESIISIVATFTAFQKITNSFSRLRVVLFELDFNRQVWFKKVQFPSSLAIK